MLAVVYDDNSLFLRVCTVLHVGTRMLYFDTLLTSLPAQLSWQLCMLTVVCA